MRSTRRNGLRLAVIGWGAIAQRVVALLAQRCPDVRIAGVATRSAPSRDCELPDGARWLAGPDNLQELAPDLVVEAASRTAVEQWGIASLRAASAFVVSSTSAFSDDAVLQGLTDEAQRCGSQILIASGALAGLDALAAAARLPLECVTHRIVKPPRAWKGTPAEELVDLDRLPTAQVFFQGSAREAAHRFPANANVTVISALAGIGLDRTDVVLVADPAATENGHHLTARGDFGSLSVTVSNRPLRENPKSSELAALSLVRLIEGRVRPLSI